MLYIRTLVLVVLVACQAEPVDGQEVQSLTHCCFEVPNSDAMRACIVERTPYNQCRAVDCFFWSEEVCWDGSAPTGSYVDEDGEDRCICANAE